jgi:hypothetical protein
MWETRFKAWQKKEKHWVYPVAILSDGRVAYKQEFEPIGTDEKIIDLEVSDDLIPVMYTGMKDKNNTEIYDGDVLSVDGGDFNKVVRWGWHEDADPYYFYGVGWNINPELIVVSEIIGNTFENPELAKGST